MKTITMIDPSSRETYEIPVPEMMDYMLQGLVPSETNDHDQVPMSMETNDIMIGNSDVDASNAVDRDIETACFETETSSELEHTKENVIIALRNLNKLNAAINILGNIQPEITAIDNTQGFSAAYSKTGRGLWQWTSGKDAKTLQDRWPKKCLSHTRADAAFQRLTRNYEFSTAVDLAQHVAAYHWRQLGHILVSSFAGEDLPKEDIKKTVQNSQAVDWTDITGAKVLQVKGGGTQLLWDSRWIWLPTSQLKIHNGTYKIPTWLARKNDMI